VNEPEPHIEVPYELRAGVWADDVDVFGDIENATLDFIRFDPRNPGGGFVVARVTPSLSCILTLKSSPERFA
jgi:hypothetical protein